MNLASALIKQILVFSDIDTWSNLRQNYLTAEYHSIFSSITKFLDSYDKLPTFEELKFFVRDNTTLERISIVEAVDVEIEPYLLLEYIKNEYTQKEALTSLHNYVEKSIAFESASETISHIYEIAAELEDKVDIKEADDDMQRMNLFESDDAVANYVALGFNKEFDDVVRFKDTDYVLIGGYRGSKKSVLMNNIAQNTLENGGSVLYYSLEMSSREVIQRQCAIATGIENSKLKYKTLSIGEWVAVATWWANRYENGDKHLKDYMEHRSFDKLHSALSKESLRSVQFHVCHDAEMTLSFIKTDSAKMVKKLGNVKLIIVDYLNQVRRFSGGAVNFKHDMYDWKEQINVSKGLRDNAMKLGVLHVSPFQTTEDGKVRLAAGLLDAPTTALVMSSPTKETVVFNTLKSRDDSMAQFASVFHGGSLRIGPESATIPVAEDKKPKKKHTDSQGLYDDPD